LRWNNKNHNIYQYIMSLLGFDTTGSATINGLTEINANNVFSDVLYYDAGTTPVNVKTAIDGITVDVTALEADVLILQGQMTTAQGDINTLQSEMNTAQSDINTLQSEMNTAQSDIIALYSITSVTAATVAGLVISQAAQDVTIAAQGISIGVLQGEMNDVEADVAALEVKTTDQSWGSLTGTSFSTKVNVGGGSGVVLNTGSASEFNSGLQSSSVEPLTVSSALAIGATQTSGTLNIGTLSTRSGDINIGTGASAKATVIGSSASTNAINGTTTIAGTANINTTSLSNTNIGNGAAGGNFTVNAAANSITGTTNTLTSTGETEINCVALDINASGATTLDTLTFNLTNTELLGTAMTWTSNTTGSDLILTNPTAGAFSIEAGVNQDLSFKSTGTGDTYFDSASDVYINPVSVFQVIAGTGVAITSTTGDLSLYAVGVGANLNINGTQIYMLGATDINQTGTAVTRIGNATGTLALTGSTNTVLGTTNINTTGTAATSIGNATGALALTGTTNTVLGTTNINTTGTAATSIGNATGALALTGTTNTVLGTTNINRTGTAATSIGNTTGALTLTGSTYTCNTTGNQTITSSAGDVALTGTDVSITTTGTSVGEFVVRANTNVDIATTTGNIELFANTTMLIKSGGTNTLEVNGANKMVTTSSTTTLTNTNITINPTTTLTNQIGGVDKLSITSTTTTHTNNSTFNGDVLIQQTTYPPTSTSALGYTNSATTFTDPMTTAFISRSNFSLPSKGVWLIVCGYEWGTNAANTVETKRITLSTTSGGTTPAAYGLQYNEEINDAAGAAGTRQFGTIMGVVSSTAALTIYVNANSSVASGANTELRTNVSWTRIG